MVDALAWTARDQFVFLFPFEMVQFAVVVVDVLAIESGSDALMVLDVGLTVNSEPFAAPADGASSRVTANNAMSRRIRAPLRGPKS